MTRLTFRTGLIASAALIASLGTTTAAHAQSTNVTLYGIMDLFVQYGHGGAGTQTSIQSGGVSSSRLGFKGSEDLGGGLSAKFQLEQGIMADTGTQASTTSTWNRQAWVGLFSQQYGSVSMGRQTLPHYDILDAMDTFGTGAGSVSSSGILNYTSRANNSVKYASPVVNGLQGVALASLGEATTPHGDSSNMYSVGATYTAGALNAGVAYNAFKPATTGPEAKYTLLTASYDLGVAKLAGTLQSIRNFGNADNADRTEAMFGVNVPVTDKNTVSAQVGANRVAHTHGGDAVQWSVGDAHELSKRTKVYAILSFINNGSNTAYSTNTATATGPVTSNGKDVSSLQLGIRHAF
mgnify:CR=1 FL=1